MRRKIELFRNDFQNSDIYLVVLTIIMFVIIVIFVRLLI